MKEKAHFKIALRIDLYTHFYTVDELLIIIIIIIMFQDDT